MSRTARPFAPAFAALLLVAACASSPTAYLRPVPAAERGQVYVRSIHVEIPADAPEALRADLRQQTAALSGRIRVQGRPVDLVLRVKPAAMTAGGPPPLASTATLVDAQSGQVVAEMQIAVPTAGRGSVEKLAPDWLIGPETTPGKATVETLQSQLLAPGYVGVAADAGQTAASSAAAAFVQNQGVAAAPAATSAPYAAAPGYAATPYTFAAPAYASAPGGVTSYDAYFGMFGGRPDAEAFAMWVTEVAGPFAVGGGPRIYTPAEALYGGPFHVGVPAVPGSEATRICAAVVRRGRDCRVVARTAAPVAATVPGQPPIAAYGH